AETELILQQFANRANSAVPQVIDVVNRTDVFAKFQQVADDRDVVIGAQQLFVEIRLQVQSGIQFQAADAGEIVLLPIEEHVFEKCPRSLRGRRITGTQSAINFLVSFVCVLDRVFSKRVAQNRTDFRSFRKKKIEGFNIVEKDLFTDAVCEFLVR